MLLVEEEKDLSEEELEKLCESALSELKDKRVLVIISDSTRTAQIPVF